VSQSSTLHLKMRFQTILRLLFSLGVSVLLLWILYAMVQKRPGGLVVEDLLTIVGNIPPWAFLLYFFCALFQAWLRALRYRLLLKTGMEAGETIPLPAMFFLTLSRNMFVDMLPMRLGEATYLILLKRVLGTRLAHGLSSLSVSFAFDLVALTALVMIMGGIALIFGQPSRPLLMLLLMLAALVSTGMALLFFGLGWLLRALEPILSRLREYSIILSMLRILKETWASIIHIRDKGVLWETFGLSLGVRFFKYAALLGFLSAILQTAFSPIALNQLDDLIIALVAGEAAASLPLPTFMSFGSYELGATWMLTTAGYTLADAAIAIFLLHLISQIIDYSLGFCGTLYCIFTEKAESRD
jgi:uncharacterized membrane protein YbhN (UPF0104 family)